MNGRVDIMNSKGISNYPLFKSNHGTQDTNFLQNIYETNALQDAFFSSGNIAYLHKNIIQNVKSQTKNIIKQQSDVNLQIIMKSIYLQFGKNNDGQIKNQIKLLNETVLEYCVKDIISNMGLYLEYKNRVSTMPVPLERPKNVSITGTKSKKNFIY